MFRNVRNEHMEIANGIGEAHRFDRIIQIRGQRVLQNVHQPLEMNETITGELVLGKVSESNHGLASTQSPP